MKDDIPDESAFIGRKGCTLLKLEDLPFRKLIFSLFAV